MLRSPSTGIVLLAAVAGLLWGAAMALVSWRGEGAEVVLMQAWIFVPAFAFGRLAATPAAGALAGLALVAVAIWAYEILPMWGLEHSVAGSDLPLGAREALVRQFDREDVVLFSTHLLGALVGFGGAMARRPDPPAPLGTPPEVAPAPPAPLWAGFEPPRPAIPDPGPEPAFTAAERAPRRWWPAAFLVAAFGIDFALDRAFFLYSDAQRTVSVALAVAGLAAAVWLARRRALAAVLAGALLALAGAAVQDAEYQDRRDQVEVIR